MKLNFGIKYKLLFVVLLIPILSILIFAIISYDGMIKIGQYSQKYSSKLGETAANDSETALKKQTIEYLLKAAKDQADISDKTFSDVRDNINVISEYIRTVQDPKVVLNSSKVVNYLTPNGEISNIYKDDFTYLSNIQNIVIPIISNNKNILSIYMATHSGATVLVSNLKINRKKFEPRERYWYKKAVAENRVIWTSAYQDEFGGGLIITCAKPCFNAEGKFIGVVAADITLQELSKNIINTETNELGYSALIDDSGKLVVGPEEDFTSIKDYEKFIYNIMAKRTGVELYSFNKLPKLGGLKSFNKSYKFNKDEKYVAYAPLLSVDWRLAIVIPQSNVIQPMVDTRQKIYEATVKSEKYINYVIKVVLIWFAALLIIMLLLVTFLSFRFSNKLIRPLLKLSKSVEMVGKGDLDHIVDINTKDEIESLANAFNQMTFDLKTYIHDLKLTIAKNERMESELKVAHAIQFSILPTQFPAFPERNEIDIFASMTPAKELGGDFYDFFFIDQNKLCLVIADVSGKGVAAALFSVITKTLIKTQAMLGLSTSEIMTTVNNILCEDNKENMFVTLFLAILDVNSGKLAFSNAGHNLPLLSRDDNDYEVLDCKPGFVLGGIKDIDYSTHEVILHNGDQLFFYTDGVTEAIDEEGKLYSEKRLKEKVNSLKNFEGEQLVNVIYDDINLHVKDVQQSDDITMMYLKYNNEKEVM